MIYKQLSYLPIIFQVDEGIILDVQDYLVRNKLLFSKVLVVSGLSHSRRIAIELVAKNNWELYTLPNNTMEDVDALKNYCLQHHVDLIIALGGGKVLDSVKRVGYLINVNNLAVPTIISNDGLISPIAVIKNHLGKTESLPGMMPMGVIIDIDVIKNSPIDYIRAAAGDILSNISATHDWVLAFQSGHETMNDIAFHLSKSASSALVHYHNVDLQSKEFLRLVVQGQINSGLAMSLAGTSRPCSGSEHLISHAIDFYGLSHQVLHGTQVASISLFTLFLQGKLKSRYIKYAQATAIPLDFTDFLSDSSDEILGQIYEKAKEMRPGRVTILDYVTKDAFIAKVKQFKSAEIFYEK